MNYPDKTVIAVSRRKVQALFGLACAFVPIGLWLATMDADSMAAQRNLSPAVVNVFGWLGVVFFGICALMFGLRLRSNKPGLVLDSEGIEDHSGGLSGGRIPWSEVAGIGSYEVMNQKMAVVYLHHPDAWIQRGNRLQQAMRKANHDQCGSPVTISAAGLDIDFPTLEALLKRYHQQYGVNR